MRLTNDMRRDTVVAALESKFKKRRDDHAKATTALAKAIYRLEFGDVAKIATKLPEVWITRDTVVHIDCAGFTWRTSTSEKQQHNALSLGGAHPVPQRQDCRPIKIAPTHHLYDQAQAVANEHQAIRAERAELESQLNGIVASVTTVDALLKLWPQAKRFLPKIKPKSTAIVPVDLINAVNASLGIKD